MALVSKLGSTYFKIGLMFLAWGFMLALRAMIVIPEEPAPIVYEYHRPEKKIDKKIEQRDTIYMLTGDWFFPYNFQLFNYPFNGCGGVIYMDNWGYPGYGFPSWGGYPLGGVVTLPGADSTNTDSLKTRSQDSLFNANNDSSAVNQLAQASINSSMKKGIGKRLFDKLSQMKINRKTRKELRFEQRKV
ncbi:MAG: hypothetical protein ACEQSL_05510 [Sediminibacterium sp.]